jgi:hypothetical protein
MQRILGGPFDKLMAGPFGKLRAGPYRAGPWPGLTARGALLIIAHALLLGMLTEWWSPLSLLPVLSATVVLRVPGVATAVCGAYLLPRSVLTLLGWPPLPPLLLAPAMAFDVLVWLRPDDLPRRRNKWRKRERRARELRGWRVLLAAVAFEIVLALAG